MDKVSVKAATLSKAIYNLAVAGCEAVDISLVAHAVRIEGITPDDVHYIQHVWSREAEETEDALGKGEPLTEDEVKIIDQGKCPKCADHSQLFKKADKIGLALQVYCASGHTFLIPPMPFTKEYIGQIIEGEPKEPVPAAEEPEEAPLPAKGKPMATEQSSEDDT
jgi:hypothetical protein